LIYGLIGRLRNDLDCVGWSIVKLYSLTPNGFIAKHNVHIKRVKQKNFYTELPEVIYTNTPTAKQKKLPKTTPNYNINVRKTNKKNVNT